MMINYLRLHESTLFYEERGFKRVESPWTVTKPVSRITAPDGSFDWEILNKNKVLVASGEQSFLYMYLKGFLPPGKFQTITPCFRDEPFDEIHTKYFMKNELIITEDVSTSKIFEVFDAAEELFSRYIPKKYLYSVETKEGLDLVFRRKKVEIELGSYGMRRCSYLKWVYGTGCAEPRLTQAIQHGIS